MSRVSSGSNISFSSINDVRNVINANTSAKTAELQALGDPSGTGYANPSLNSQPTSNSTTYTTPGTYTYTVPSGVTQISVIITGGGGGGATGNPGIRYGHVGGGGGGGGGGVVRTTINVTPGSTISVGVGGGGAVGKGGGDSYVGSTRAYGGQPGADAGTGGASGGDGGLNGNAGKADYGGAGGETTQSPYGKGGAGGRQEYAAAVAATEGNGGQVIIGYSDPTGGGRAICVPKELYDDVSATLDQLFGDGTLNSNAWHYTGSGRSWGSARFSEFKGAYSGVPGIVVTPVQTGDINSNGRFDYYVTGEWVGVQPYYVAVYSGSSVVQGWTSITQVGSIACTSGVTWTFYVKDYIGCGNNWSLYQTRSYP